jgi:Ca-activated chloride channel family protein
LRTFPEDDAAIGLCSRPQQDGVFRQDLNNNPGGVFFGRLLPDRLISRLSFHGIRPKKRRTIFLAFRSRLCLRTRTVFPAESRPRTARRLVKGTPMVILRSFPALFVPLLLVIGFLPRVSRAQKAPATSVFEEVTRGALRTVDEKGKVVECPLKATDVRAKITGLVARVRVSQTFHNPYPENIEAIYVFPLPHTAAVDEMTMVIGERRIRGEIRRREEAEKIYREALKGGKTASLLRQERPNIFTQAVGNIPRESDVKIEISYVDVLRYDDGGYAFRFPMVVGPRYIPGAPISAKPKTAPGLKGKVGEVPGSSDASLPDAKGSGTSSDTRRVPDASRITPPVLKPGFRTGHGITLSVRLDAGVPIRDLRAEAHEIAVEERGPEQRLVRLSPKDSLPNKDFVLRYRTAWEKPRAAVRSALRAPGDGTVLVMVQPSEDADLLEAPARDLCFLVDVSGSMGGAPIEKVREIIRDFLGRMRAVDRMQIVAFAGAASSLFPSYVPTTPENIQKALDFASRMRAGGGTRMLEGVRQALAEPDPARTRIVVMLTDGYIGNEDEIIAEAGNRCGEKLRFWVIGIGSSPNMHLIDGVARVGGGMGETVNLGEEPGKVVDRMTGRMYKAQLTGIRLHWAGVAVTEVVPERIPDLWATEPVVLLGRYTRPGEGVLTVTASAEGTPVTMSVPLRLSAEVNPEDGLANVWARRKIRRLNLERARTGKKDLKEKIVALALSYRLVSAYTSFVAVEEVLLADPAGGPPKKKAVPVPIPEGTRFRGFFGKYWNSAIGIGGGAGGCFGGRFGGKRNLRAYGGGRKTESAVLLSLVWLKKHQNPDGSWSCDGFTAHCAKEPRCTGKGAGSDLEATGLSLLAFLGAGHTHKHGKFKSTVKRTLVWLKARQGEDGSFSDAHGTGADTLTHAICTMALTECYGLSAKTPLLKDACEKALARLLGLQKPGSGWGRTTGAAPDTLTTSWASLALKAARLTGLAVPKEAVEGALRFFDTVTDGASQRVEQGGKPSAEAQGTPLTPTAAALAARIFLRVGAKDPKVRGGAALLGGRLPAADPSKGSVDEMYIYFGTLACFQLGGETWKKWNAPLKSALVPTQERKGCPHGSWAPRGKDGRGRVRATALNTLSLEVYYRYGRILNKK